MSILIKGIEMPTERESFNLAIKYNGTVLDTETGMQIAEAYELPPHGRLIEEADAIETAWMILRGLGYLKEENPKLEQTVREVFATAPAIEVE